MILLSVKRLRIYQFIAGYIPLPRDSVSIILCIIPLHVVLLFPRIYQWDERERCWFPAEVIFGGSWSPLLFVFPGVQEGVSSPFPLVLIIFARVCYQCRERELSTRKLEGYMDREGLFGVMSPGQQNKVPDSETGGCWGADRKARVTTDTARSCLEGKSR